MQLVAAIVAGVAAPLAAAENCNTALSRLARAEVVRAIEQHRHTACEELNGGAIGLDKTKALELKDLKVCEDGPVVTASIAIRIECATSPSAVWRTSQGDTLSAAATANLDTCKVSNVKVSAAGFLADQVLQQTGASARLKDEAEKAIKKFCATPQ